MFECSPIILLTPRKTLFLTFRWVASSEPLRLTSKVSEDQEIFVISNVQGERNEKVGGQERKSGACRTMGSRYKFRILHPFVFLFSMPCVFAETSIEKEAGGITDVSINSDQHL